MFASVIVPVYNQKPWLADCLNSLLAQTDGDFEVLLIDDGSTDGSEALCDAYAGKDGRFSVFHSANRGVSTARNLAIGKARGQYICFVDADDAVHPQWMEAFHRAAERTHRDIYTWGWIESVSRPAFSMLNSNVQETMTGEELLWSVLKPDGKAQGFVWNKAFRRELVLGIAFDPKLVMHEDVLFCCTVLARYGLALDCAALPYPFYWYRQRENSACTAPFSSRLLQIPAVKDRVCDLLMEVPKHEADYLWLQNQTLRIICVMQKKLLHHRLPDGNKQMRELECLYGKYRQAADDGEWDAKLKAYRALSEIRYRLGRKEK